MAGRQGAPYFHLAGSLVIRQLILVEGTSPRDELVDATGSLVLIVRLLLVRVIPPTRAFSLSHCADLSLFFVVASLSLTSSLLLSFMNEIFSLVSLCRESFYLVRSLTASSLVPGLRRHYRWRALNVFCLFHLPARRLSSQTYPHSPCARLFLIFPLVF